MNDEEKQRIRQAKIAEIDEKLRNIRICIISTLILLIAIICGGLYTEANTPVKSTYTPVYTPQPSAKPVATSTPKPSATPMPAVPYVGMYVSYVPSRWQWQGTDNLTVKDAAGNGIRTIKYRYDAPPKIYVIWVSESTNKVVKVSVTDPTASSNRKSTTNKKSSSDPYQAKDYAHPDDFYYDYYDDFWDYEDAEDYWERHH